MVDWNVFLDVRLFSPGREEFVSLSGYIHFYDLLQFVYPFEMLIIIFFSIAGSQRVMFFINMKTICRSSLLFIKKLLKKTSTVHILI